MEREREKYRGKNIFWRDFHQNNLRSELSIFLIDYFFKIYNLFFYFLLLRRVVTRTVACACADVCVLLSVCADVCVLLSVGVLMCVRVRMGVRVWVRVSVHVRVDVQCSSRFARFIGSNRIQCLNGDSVQSEKQPTSKTQTDQNQYKILPRKVLLSQLE